jgi:hypothetical protein
MATLNWLLEVGLEAWLKSDHGRSPAEKILEGRIQFLVCAQKRGQHPEDGCSIIP